MLNWVGVLQEEADTVLPGLAHFQTCYSQVHPILNIQHSLLLLLLQKPPAAWSAQRALLHVPAAPNQMLRHVDWHRGPLLHCLQVLLDKSEMDMEIGQLREDIQDIEATLESMVVGRFAGGYRVGAEGDSLCVIRSRSRLAL